MYVHHVLHVVDLSVACWCVHVRVFEVSVVLPSVLSANQGVYEFSLICALSHADWDKQRSVTGRVLVMYEYFCLNIKLLMLVVYLRSSHVFFG